MRFPISAVAIALSFLVVTAATAAPRGRIVRAQAVKSTVQLIDEAVARGEISEETGLIYQVFASFGDERLPDRYRGPLATFGADTFAVADVVSRYESLSEEAKATLAPYLMPPFYQGSLQAGRNDEISTKAMAVCGPMDSDWSSIRSPSGQVRIWWDSANTDDAQLAAGLTGVADRALLSFTGLLGRQPLPDGGSELPCRGGDDAIDVAFTDGISQTVPYFPGTKEVSSYVLLQRKPQDGPVMTLVHELFHVFQYTYDVEEFGLHVDYKWLMEATAQWAQHYYSPEGNSGLEQRAAPFFLDEPEKSLDETNKKREYGAYLFFLYLTEKFGDGIMKSVWDATTGADALHAVDSAIPGGFRERWPEFALYNWNQDKENHYEQWDSLTTHAASRGGMLLAPGRPDQHIDLVVDLPHLSATYKHFTFTPEARSFAFLNGITFNLTTGPRPPLFSIEFGEQYQWSDRDDELRNAATVQVLIKKNGEWQTSEKWTEEQYKPFCRQKDDEKIDEIVLIFANSSLDSDATLQPVEKPPMLIVTNMGCKWDGEANFDLAGNLEAAVGDLKVTFEIERTPQDPMTYRDSFLGYPLAMAGKAKFTAKGKIGDCSVDDGGDLPIREIVQFSYNFAPLGSETHRKVLFPMNIPQTIPVDVQCPGVGTVETSIGFGTTYPPLPDEMFDVDSEGVVKGEEDEIDGHWEWEFKPVD